MNTIKLTVVLALLILIGSWQSVAAANYVLQIRRASDFVSVPDADSLDLTANFTLEAWINASSFLSDVQGVVSKRRSESGGGVRLGVLQVTAHLGFNDGKGFNVVF